MSEKCLFTGYEAEISYCFKIDGAQYKSTACGVYLISPDAQDYILHKKLRENNKQGLVNCASATIIDNQQRIFPLWCIKEEINNASSDEMAKQNIIPRVLEDYIYEPVDHSEKPINLLKILSRRLMYQSASQKIDLKREDYFEAKIIDDDEAEIVLTFLADKGLISNRPELSGNIFILTPFSITFKGWGVLSEKKPDTGNKKVFIATQFEWLNDIPCTRRKCTEAIKKSCAELGYQADIVNQDHTDNINNVIISEIKKSRFVVAELTYNNPGVYFESGFARGLGIPVFHLVNKDYLEKNKLHFDIAHIMCRTWNTPEELTSILKPWIEATV